MCVEAATSRGQWSEVVRGREERDESGKRESHSTLKNARSSRARVGGRAFVQPRAETIREGKLKPRERVDKPVKSSCMRDVEVGVVLLVGKANEVEVAKD